MEVAGAAAAAAVGTAGAGMFSYNRANYMMDAKNRYTRYTAGLNMAIAQTGMYRQDITDLTNIVVTRQDVYHVIAAMGLTSLTAIYCPGRLGLHTPPPPGWLMGLAFTNIAGAYMFLGLTVWMCMHAAARCDTAATHLLTRFVRLPIPSQGMLDKARKFASSYEEQPWREIFRVPFTKHATSGEDKSYNEGEGYDFDDEAAARSRRGHDVPAWYRMEKEVGRANTIDTLETMMPLDAQGNKVPEHFEAYRELQQEWFPYDVYSRVCIFLAFMHLTSCWSFMQIGHSLTETRALFACAIIQVQMFVLQQIIITLDVIPKGMPLYRLGPFSFFTAFVGCAIEYQRWFTPGAQAFGFVMVWISYALEIIYTIALFQICAPSDDPPPVAESAGAAWWPSEWCLPSQFQHAMWLVAPPKELEPGLNDITLELRDAQRGVEGSPVAKQTSTNSDRQKRADVMRALGKHNESNAWWNVKIGLGSMLVAWVFMTIGFTVEVMYQGTATPSFLSAPGLPNNARDPRYRPAKLGGHEPTEVGTGGLHGPARGVHMGTMHRRLADLDFTPEFLATAVQQPFVAHALQDLMPHLYELAGTGRVQSSHKAPVADMPSEESKYVKVQWPALFEPEILACGPESPVTIALSRHGRGSLISLTSGDGVEPATFILEGVAPHGPLAAAAWDAHGLLLMTSTGVTMECPGSGPSSHGRWLCNPLAGAKLPLSIAGKMLANRVAIARGPQGMRAAVLFPGDGSVTVFSRASREAAPWLPAGEVSTTTPDAMPSFSVGAETLLLTSADGGVTHMHMETGHVTLSAIPMSSERSWPSTCRLPTGGLVRLSREAGKLADLLLS